MAVGPASVVGPARLAGRATRRRGVLEREGVFSWLMLAPGVAFLLPFIVPTVLSTFACMWIRDPTFCVINWTLRHTGLVTQTFSWLGNATLAMVSIIVVNPWRGVPFYGITLLAGLQTISPDLYEAAAIDGASLTQRFWYITLPVLKPVLIIVTMFSVIFTFSDFQLPYVLTHGGPATATALFATWAFDIGMSACQLGM